MSHRNIVTPRRDIVGPNGQPLARTAPDGAPPTLVDAYRTMMETGEPLVIVNKETGAPIFAVVSADHFAILKACIEQIRAVAETVATRPDIPVGLNTPPSGPDIPVGPNTPSGGPDIPVGPSTPDIFSAGDDPPTTGDPQ